MHTVYVLIIIIFASINFRELLEFPQFRKVNFFYLVHILGSCTCQYECDNVLDGFWGPGDGYQSDTGSETVPGQIFASINFHGQGFIRKYSENLYTAKISTYMALL